MIAAVALLSCGHALAGEGFDFDRRRDAGNPSLTILESLPSLPAVTFRMPEVVAIVASARGPSGVALLKANEPVPSFGIKMLTVIEVDPSRAEVRTVSAKSAVGRVWATLPKVMAAVPGAAAGMNAGFFTREDGALIGFFMERGKVLAHVGHPSMNRIFMVDGNGKPRIVVGTSAGPGGIVSAVAGKSAWEESSRSARAAVCITRSGRVRLVAAYPVQDLDHMAQYLSAKEGCASVVHLDGGGSTQMAFGENGLSTGWERKEECRKPALRSPDQCFRQVPTFLVVVPRAR
ncbi:MAG: phosphodiester glycosidase family protein [Elusimicrobia bacterium]|nr:phosphodiester glycosidase family protein [Elusimicrobiota bacterium]